MELTLSNITHKYGSFTALHSIDLTMTAGVYALLGPNGAGKSTMMNLITGILTPTIGEIFYNRKPIRKLGKDFLSVLSYMPQQQGMYENFTAIRFLSYIGSLKGMKEEKLRLEIPKVLSLVNLKSAGEKMIGEMSGGMKQRLLIAQAVMNDPEVLILDEPTAGLDPKERIRIRNIISEIAVNKIVLYATHVVSDIEHLAKRVILIGKGRLLEKVGSPSELSASLSGKVFETTVSEEKLKEVKEHYVISAMAQEEKGLRVRIVTEDAPKEEGFHTVFPSLEDVYLYYFQVREKNGG